jgi:hypothetical protein
MNGDVRGLTLHITPITLPRLHGPLGMVSSIRRQRPTQVLFALCADTLVTVYFGWQSTIALAQTGTPDSMVLFAGFAF